MTLQTDIGAYITGRYQDIIEAVAGGAGDAVEMDGIFVDGRSFHSAKLIVGYITTLASAETLTIAANLQHADDAAGANAEDFGPAFTAAILETGVVTGAVGEVELHANLIADEVGGDVAVFRGFIRGQATPTLSAVGTDVANLAMMLVLGGADVLPAV
jgi:hypothetical protein